MGLFSLRFSHGPFLLPLLHRRGTDKACSSLSPSSTSLHGLITRPQSMENQVLVSIYNALRTAEKICIKFWKPLLSANYLLGTGWALGSDSAGSEKHKWYHREVFPPKWQEDVCRELSEPIPPLLTPPGGRYGTWALGTDAVLSSAGAVEEPAVAK